MKGEQDKNVRSGCSALEWALISVSQKLSIVVPVVNQVGFLVGHGKGAILTKLAVALASAGAALANPAQAAQALFTSSATEANLGAGPCGTVSESAGALDFV